MIEPESDRERLVRDVQLAMIRAFNSEQAGWSDRDLMNAFGTDARPLAEAIYDLVAEMVRAER